VEVAREGDRLDEPPTRPLVEPPNRHRGPIYSRKYNKNSGVIVIVHVRGMSA